MARGLRSSATKWGAALLAANLCALSAAAQALRDPTRPPVMTAQGKAAGSMASAWVLQSVLISKERRYAVINGQVVSPGELVSGAELVAIAENRVMLRTQEGLKSVHLFPDVARQSTEQVEKGTAKQRAEALAPQRGSKGNDTGTPGADK